MKQLILFACALLLALNICAQTRVIKDERGDMITEINYLTERIARYKGSIFLKDSVELGTFLVAGGQQFQKPVLFDIMNQRMLADFGNDFESVKNTDLQLGNRTFTHINGVYYETCYDAKVKILVKYGCVFKPFDKGYKFGALPQFGTGYSGEIVHKKYYFLQFPDKKLRPISLNNHSVAGAIMKQYDGVLYHIRKWNKKINTEEDVADLLGYLSGEGIF